MLNATITDMTNIIVSGRFRNKIFFFGNAPYAEKYNLYGIVGHDTNSKLHFLLLEFTKNVQISLKFDIHEGPLGKRLMPNLTHDPKGSLYPRTRKRSHVAICSNYHHFFFFSVSDLGLAKRSTCGFPE
jgi:hypothetical protein